MFSAKVSMRRKLGKAGYFKKNITVSKFESKSMTDNEYKAYSFNFIHNFHF